MVKKENNKGNNNKDFIEVDGTVIEALPATQFKVELEDKSELGKLLNAEQYKEICE